MIKSKTQVDLELVRQKAYEDRTQNNNNNEVRCPRCGSTSLSVNKKGYSFKKAVVGVGIFADEIGTNKIMVTCLHCGKQFKAGK